MGATKPWRKIRASPKSCGQNRRRAAAIARRPHSMTAEAREHTTLMEIGRAAVVRIYDDHAWSAARFHDAINQELLQALCTQDCRAASEAQG
jgi:CRP-like cAMP-binding protein